MTKPSTPKGSEAKGSRPKKSKSRNHSKAQAKAGGNRGGRRRSDRGRGRNRNRDRRIPPMNPNADQTLQPVLDEIGVPEPKPFLPDPFQMEAIDAIRDADCLVTAPTGAGKTWIAEEAAKAHLDAKGRIWYATPLKALTNTIYNRFKSVFGDDA
ncbi:MAG: DEAD/DEAH box helicase, partial [Desulfobacterales bacterium]|nr:DEAD/DEAH box helicase [Desulfobacterales bacterium]